MTNAREPLASFFLGLALIVGTTAAPSDSSPVGMTFKETDPAPPALHVDGNKLLDSTGQTVQLRGVNRSGTEYACIQGWGIFSGPDDAASIAAIKSWGVNAVRVPLNEHCWLAINGVAASYAGTNYQQAIVNYVSLLNEYGLYTILDLHWSAPGTTPATSPAAMPDMDHSPAFWSEVASTFKGNNAVIFELFNEPWPDNQADSDAAWTCWRDGGTCPGVPFEAAGMQTLLNAVRASGATNVVTVTGIQWGNNISRWQAYKPSDPLNNLAAGWHAYNFNVCNSTSCYDSTAGPVAALFPVLVTETGSDSCDNQFMWIAMDWLDARGQSYFPWSWNAGSGCSMSLISDYAGTPTDYGQVYKQHLALRLGANGPRGDQWAR